MIPSIVSEYIDLFRYVQRLSVDADEEEIEDCECRLDEIWSRMSREEKDLLDKILRD